jgi:mannosyltransferase OCH1-like enzyme
MQTSATNTMSKNRYNSILTILNYSPQFPYIFFDDNDIFAFVKRNYSKIINDAINNLIPGAFVSDLFRYCYLYLYGGIYIDCKKILFQPMNDFLTNTTNTTNTMTNEIYVRDIPYNFAYNAIMICDKMSQIIRECIQVTVYNIVRSDMKDDTLKITGPGVLGDAIDKITKKTYQYEYFNKMLGDWRSCIYKNEILFFQNSYYGYYDENNYLKERHYDTLWRKKKVFKTDLRKKYSISSPYDIGMFRNMYNPKALST